MFAVLQINLYHWKHHWKADKADLAEFHHELPVWKLQVYLAASCTAVHGSTFQETHPGQHW